jgi:Family of unknown function (DUF5990)
MGSGSTTRNNEDVQIRILGTQLPGRECGASENFPGYSNIHVGVQRKNRRDELLDLHPGDAASAEWTLDCSVDGTDIRGPHIQGRPGERFIYLSWGTVDDDGRFTLFRREADARRRADRRPRRGRELRHAGRNARSHGRQGASVMRAREAADDLLELNRVVRGRAAPRHLDARCLTHGALPPQ